MNDFDRLVETSPHSLTRELLGAGLHDAPAPSAAPRVAAAIGLSVGVAGAPVLAASAAGGGALASGSASLGIASVAKWLGVGLLAGTVVSGGAAVVRRTATAPARTSVAVTVAPATANDGLGTPRSTLDPAPTAAPHVGGAPPAPPAPPASTARSARTLPAASAPAVATLPDQASALAHEVARIDEVRLALRGGDPSAALIALARYDEERQTGVLDREAAVLRIEALRRAGKLGLAKEHARRYLVRFPSDAHSASLRQLLGDGDAPQGIDR